MRRRVAFVAALAVLGALVLYATRPNAGPTTEIPTPTANATPSAISSPTVALSPSPPAPSSTALPNIDLKAHVVAVPRDFRYIATGSRLLVLDLAAGAANEVAALSCP